MLKGYSGNKLGKGTKLIPARVPLGARSFFRRGHVVSIPRKWKLIREISPRGRGVEENRDSRRFAGDEAREESVSGPSDAKAGASFERNGLREFYCRPPVFSGRI